MEKKMILDETVPEKRPGKVKEGNKGISRRKFVFLAGRLTGAVTAGLFCLDGTIGAAVAGDRSASGCLPARARMELRFSGKLCAGCRLCEVACAQFHEGNAGHTTCRNRVTVRPLLQFAGVSALSANATGWPQPLANATFAEFSENHFCRQCASPECLDICPEVAIYVHPRTGARVVNEEKCVGCGECVSACQFEMIQLNEETGKAIKCDLCDGEPQCARWCPTGAITVKRL